VAFAQAWCVSPASIAATSGPLSTSTTRFKAMADGFMRGLAALRLAHYAKKMLQIRKGPGGVLVLASEHINNFGRFHLDGLSAIGGGPCCAEVPLKVREGRFHANQIV
jgi:hypothetical protein